MDQGEILGALGVAFSVITAIVTAVNHKRCRSRCCKKEFSASVHIEEGTPPKLSLPPTDGNSGGSGIA